MRAAALALLLASPARAEDNEALRQKWHRRGVTLTAVGLAFAAIGVAGLLVLATTSACGNTSGWRAAGLRSRCRSSPAA